MISIFKSDIYNRTNLYDLNINLSLLNTNKFVKEITILAVSMYKEELKNKNLDIFEAMYNEDIYNSIVNIYKKYFIYKNSLLLNNNLIINNKFIKENYIKIFKSLNLKNENIDFSRNIQIKAIKTFILIHFCRNELSINNYEFLRDIISYREPFLGKIFILSRTSSSGGFIKSLKLNFRNNNQSKEIKFIINALNLNTLYDKNHELTISDFDIENIFNKFISYIKQNTYLRLNEKENTINYFNVIKNYLLEKRS